MVETPIKNNTTPQVKVVPVEADPSEVAAPPPPPKLERQTNQSTYSREEALAEDEVHEYDKVVKQPIAPVVMQPLTRVDKLRMLARNGLP